MIKTKDMKNWFDILETIQDKNTDIGLQHSLSTYINLVGKDAPELHNIEYYYSKNGMFKLLCILGHINCKNILHKKCHKAVICFDEVFFYEEEEYNYLIIKLSLENTFDTARIVMNRHIKLFREFHNEFKEKKPTSK